MDKSLAVCCVVPNIALGHIDVSLLVSYGVLGSKMPGIRQLLEQYTSQPVPCGGGGPSSAAEVPGGSALGTKLLELWGLGNLSAVQVQQLAHCALLDGSRHPELQNLASLGAVGTATGNCSRDLKRFILQESKLWIPPAYVVRVPCRDPKARMPGLEHWEDAAVLLPHQLISALYQHRPEDFKAFLGTARTTSFWQSISAEDPRLVAKGGHPTKGWAPGWEATTVPLWLHGDGVEFADRDSLQTYSWGSVLSMSSSMDSSFLLAAFPKSVTVKGQDLDTWGKLWQVMRWSLQACCDGMHPSEDHKGNPFDANSVEAKLAGHPLTQENHRFVVWCLLGDLEYLVNHLCLPHWATDQFCFLCNGCRSDASRHWQDFSNSPGWQMKDPAECLEPLSKHPVFSLPGVSEFNVVLDVLHVLDHNGVAGHLLGSIIHMMVFTNENRTRAAREGALQTLWNRIQELYGELQVSTRLTNLNMSMVADIRQPFADYAHLRAVKGAETRHLVHVMAKIADEWARTEEQQHAARACLLLAFFYFLLDNAGMFPAPGDGSEMEQIMVEFLLEYAWLSAWATGCNRKLFHIVPKHHFARHLGTQCRWFNPRFGWTYKAESWVGKISHLAHSCTSGCRVTKLSLPLVEKYSMLLHIRLSRMIFSD